MHREQNAEMFILPRCTKKGPVFKGRTAELPQEDPCGSHSGNTAVGEEAIGLSPDSLLVDLQ